MPTIAPETKVRVLSPMLAAEDVRVTLDFYTSVLGFAIVMDSTEYAIVERDGATIHFMKAADESVMQAVRGHAEIYIEVTNIVPLWEHVQQFKGQYRIKDLYPRDYGMTEFHIEDPNGCLVFVGEETKTAGSGVQA